MERICFAPLDPLTFLLPLLLRFHQLEPSLLLDYFLEGKGWGTLQLLDWSLTRGPDSSLAGDVPHIPARASPGVRTQDLAFGSLVLWPSWLSPLPCFWTIWLSTNYLMHIYVYNQSWISPCVVLLLV
jgi:hypothetical protein